MEINLFDIVQHILNVAVLYVIVRTLLYKPVRQFMTNREEAISQRLEQANETAREAVALHEEYKTTLDNATQETRKIVEQRTAEADRAYHEITDKAERQALDIIDTAQMQASQYRQETMQELKKEVAGMAVDIASKILEREVSEDDNKAIIDEFFAGWADNG